MATPKKAGLTTSNTTIKISTSRLKSWMYRVRNAVAGLLGLGLITATSPTAGQASVPQHWIAYAQLASGQLQGWLGDGSNESAQRLQEWGQKHLSNSAASAVENAVIVRLWVAPSGKVERAEFASLGDAQADADLRHVLTEQAISEPPPNDMALPMTLGLTIALPEPSAEQAADPVPQ